MKTFEDITKGITGFESICEKNGDKPGDIHPYASPINELQKALNDRAEHDYVAKYLQDGFVADYGNRNQDKWFPVFVWDKNKSAFVFAFSDYDRTLTDAAVGSRLSFPTEKMSKFFANITAESHNRLLANKY